MVQQLNYIGHKRKNQNQKIYSDEYSINKQIKNISIMSFVAAFALILSLSSFAGNVKKADSAAMEMAYEMILSPEEELALANEVMNSTVEELVVLSEEIYIYDQDNNLIHHASGSTEELQQDNQLQVILANSNLLMEDGQEKYYVKK